MIYYHLGDVVCPRPSIIREGAVVDQAGIVVGVRILARRPFALLSVHWDDDTVSDIHSGNVCLRGMNDI